MSKELPSLNYQQRQNLKYVKQEDPPFIQEMLKKVGYQEVTINDKVCILIFNVFNNF